MPSWTPVDFPDRQIVGIAAVHARDTEHQQPTQMLGQRVNWPSMPNITSVVDAADNSATTGYMGGSLPDHSSHWSDYLNSMWQILPSGKQYAFTANPDPTPVAGMISQQQDQTVASGEDPWHTIMNNFGRMWRKGAPPSTYKLPHP
jgi:hypothetical protein